MKIKKNYLLRDILGSYIVMGTDRDAYRPNELMSVNETGKFLWDKLVDGADRDELVEALTNEYEVDEATAGKDVDAFLGLLREQGLIEE